MKPFYQDKYITIYNADCREVMPTPSSIDLIITDPPYGVGFKYPTYDDTEENFYKNILPVINTCVDNFRSVVCCMSMKRLFDMPRPKSLLCWAKPGSTRLNPMGGFSEWEPILVYGKARYMNDFKYLPDFSNHLKEAGNHPCPKPINLFLWLVGTEVTKPQHIFDPFMGSGTTLVACKTFGRHAIGAEVDEGYCEIAAKRCMQESFEFDYIENCEKQETMELK
jgi:DNA modification methylase